MPDYSQVMVHYNLKKIYSLDSGLSRNDEGSARLIKGGDEMTSLTRKIHYLIVNFTGQDE